MTTEQFEQKQAAISNEELIQLALKQVSELAKTGGKSHTMSVPPMITDTDMIFCELIKRFEKLTNRMVVKKEWTEFRSTGLLLFINQILHVFGWAIVFDMDNDEVKSVYPAKVKFRGFDNDSVSESYQKISEYMKQNVNDL